jgi:hypothetical protein
MSVITQSDINKIIQVDPYSQKLISLISILEAYLNLISKEYLQLLGKSDLKDITLKDLGILYKTFFSINNGVNGVCWEYTVFNAIYNNDTYIQDLLNVAINYLSGENNFYRLNAILWGGEKSNLSSDNIKNNLKDDETIWTPNKEIIFKDYVDIILRSFHDKDLRKNLPLYFEGIWKTDLFVKKENSNRWYAVTVKWNKYEVKQFPGLSIGIHFKHMSSVKDSVNPKLTKNNFVYCSIPFDLNLGEHYAYMFRFVDTMLSEINLKKKNTLWLKFPSIEENALFNNLYELRKIPCYNIIQFLKSQYNSYTNTFEQPEMILATDRYINFSSNEIGELKQSNSILITPNQIHF